VVDQGPQSRIFMSMDTTLVGRARVTSTGSETSRTIPIRLDVREEEGWERAVSEVLESQGHLDVLVHAAGIAAASPLAETTLAEWRRVLSTNLDGSFLAIKHGVQAMREAGGAIVVIGSASGIRASAGAAAYSTSKAAVSMLVRSAAKECRESGIPVRINTVSPGGVKTPLWRAMPFFRDLVELHGSEDGAFAACCSLSRMLRVTSPEWNCPSMAATSSRWTGSNAPAAPRLSSGSPVAAGQAHFDETA